MHVILSCCCPSCLWSYNDAYASSSCCPIWPWSHVALYVHDLIHHDAHDLIHHASCAHTAHLHHVVVTTHIYHPWPRLWEYWPDAYIAHSCVLMTTPNTFYMFTMYIFASIYMSIYCVWTIVNVAAMTTLYISLCITVYEFPWLCIYSAFINRVKGCLDSVLCLCLWLS